MCQTAFSVIPSPHALPTLFTLRNSFPSQSRLLRASRLFRFAPNRALEPFGCGLPFRQDQRSLSALRAAEGDPISTLRLRASSTRRQAAVPAMRGRVFLSVAEDRAPAKAHDPVLL
jgi:hypothetical protein